MKIIKTGSFRAAIVFLLFVSLLSGCASVPFGPSQDYFKHLYRRMQYTMEGRNRVIDIFYATTRRINDRKTHSLYFTSHINDGITTGSANIKINPHLTIGKMMPYRLKRRGIIGIQNIEKTDEETFLKQLSEAVKQSPHKSLLVVVFGYKDDFEATMIKAAYFAYLLDVNTPVLLFDWPGDQPVSMSGYKKAQGLAVASGPYLGELLAKIERRINPEKLWIKASSMGCQVVCDAFEYMHKHGDFSDPDAEIDHVILAAPDVGEEEFDLKFKNELTSMSRRLTAYVSSDDEALLMSSFLNRDERLGRQTADVKEPEQLEESKDLLYLKSMHPDLVTIIDVTPVNRASYKHGYYLESPEFFDDFYMRIFDKNPNVNRRLYLLKAKDNTDYWVLR